MALTRLEIMRNHKAQYSDFQLKIQGMTGLTKEVATRMTLKWIKGRDWLGGISDAEYNRALESLEKLGYDIEESDAEFVRQMNLFV